MTLALPPNAGPARDAAILALINAGQFEVQWSTVRSHTADNAHHGEFRVFADALKINGVRINVSAELAQQIADKLGCMLMTPKLDDLCWLQRTVTLPPITQPPVNMDTTALMIKESAAIDTALAAQGNPTGLIRTIGKNWVLSNTMLDANGRPKMLSGVPMAVNYGWQYATPTFQGQTWEKCASDPANCHLVQGQGFRHDFHHTDYSQMCTLVSRRCFIDGAERDLAQVLQDPILAPLASHQGVLKVLRQPGVPETPMIVSATPCVGPGCPQFVTWSSTAPSSPTSSGGTAMFWTGALLLAGGFLGAVALFKAGH
jgi:hypothetical protein